MEDPAAFGGYGGCRTTAEASPAIGDMGAVLATVPARRVSLVLRHSFILKKVVFDIYEKLNA